MGRVFIIANESEQLSKLSSGLVQRGFACSTAPYNQAVIDRVVEQSPDLVLLDIDGASTGPNIWALPQEIRQERHIPVIALISREMLDNLNKIIPGKGFPQNRNYGKGFLAMTPSFFSSIDDFAVKPWDTSEVTARIKRTLKQTNGTDSEGVIRCGDLIIDTPRCQVSLGNRPVTLTFREYQLLKFLASNEGKVFTRETLLDKVWGWDYYGGDRTVDVHIRRLRSKIEDKNHSFIDTVRNIGYRFK